ncbi:MAG: hypothetical protein IPI14_11380 [Polaromonas sp.]|nr:hypothetical protein [Polaromonas sp.]
MNNTGFDASFGNRLTTQTKFKALDKKITSSKKTSSIPLNTSYIARPYLGTLTENSQEYLLKPLYHPYTCLFIRQLSKFGADGLYRPDIDSSKVDDEDLYQQKTPHSGYDFDELYGPTDSVIKEYPVEKIDFSLLSPYGLFNNEMFFYSPMLIATRLMQNQKFEDARKWFHYIFDPTSTQGQGGARIWRYSVFANTYNQLMSGIFISCFLVMRKVFSTISRMDSASI